MVISVASGKGGTGKTTVAASLAAVIPGSLYIDCDVEEPNGHLLLSPAIIEEFPVSKMLPHFNYYKCDFCGSCVEVCEFNALLNLKSEILLFEEMCHSCGACEYFCPQKAIMETPKEIGILREGVAKNGVLFFDGLLNIGEISAVTLIKEVKVHIDKKKINVIDSPPGTSCSMIETVKDSDYCILVTESTPFGLNDLKLAVNVMDTIKVPFGVVINKHDNSFNDLEDYLAKNRINILLKIPFERKIAEAYSSGVLPVEAFKEYRKQFEKLFETINTKTGGQLVNAG